METNPATHTPAPSPSPAPPHLKQCGWKGRGLMTTMTWGGWSLRGPHMGETPTS